jgi:hypothetical protein
LFTNANQLDLVVKALAKWVLAKPFRLSDVFSGTWLSVPLMILLLSIWLLAVFRWLLAASRALLVQVAGSRLIICRSAGPVFRCLAGLGGLLDGDFFFQKCVLKVHAANPNIPLTFSGEKTRKNDPKTAPFCSVVRVFERPFLPKMTFHADFLRKHQSREHAGTQKRKSCFFKKLVPPIPRAHQGTWGTF